MEEVKSFVDRTSVRESKVFKKRSSQTKKLINCDENSSTALVLQRAACVYKTLKSNGVVIDWEANFPRQQIRHKYGGWTHKLIILIC